MSGFSLHVLPTTLKMDPNFYFCMFLCLAFAIFNGSWLLILKIIELQIRNSSKNLFVL